MGAFGTAFESALNRQHEKNLASTRELVQTAHDFWFPTVQKWASGDPSVTDEHADLAMKQISSALSQLGDVGKQSAAAMRHAAEQQRLVNLRTRAIDQFRAQPAPTGPAAPPAAGPQPIPGTPRNFTPPGTYGREGTDLSALVAPGPISALPGTSPVEPESLRANPADVTRAAAARESAIDTAKFSAQREAQLREAQELSKFKLGQVESLRGPGGQIELNPETLIKAGALGIGLPMFSRGIVPQKIETDASQLSPEQVSAYQSLYGQPPQGKVTLLRNNISGETVGMFPGWAGTQTVTTPSGGVGNLNRGTGTVAPIAGAVPSSQAAQHLVTGPQGQQFFIRPMDVAAGTAIPGAVNPQFSPRTSTSTRIVDIGGQLTPVQVTSTSSRGGVRAAAPAAPPPAAPAPAKPSGPSARTGASLGPSPAQYKREIENPLTPGAQSVVIAAQPTRNLVDRAMTEMAKMGMDKSDVPGTTFLPRLAYALGYGTDLGQFLGDLSMESITSGGAVLRTAGGVRAVQALNKAMVHTPETWHDSGKLMYSKMKAIRARLDEVIKVAREEGQKYPGMNRGGGSSPEGGVGAPKKSLEEIFGKR